jgi:hypothetical protein
MKPTTRNRVFALDLHPLSFGYAMFEGPEELIDWGIKNFRHGVNAVKVPQDAKLALLLDQYGPDVVVIKEPRTATIEKMVHVIINLPQCRRIPVRRISSTVVRKAFPGESHNKYQIASVIAKRYPELSPRLGPRRKFWEAEKYSMSIFDAAAIGLAYLMRDATTDNDNDRTLLTLPR